jgi:hypothetical protein
MDPEEMVGAAGIRGRRSVGKLLAGVKPRRMALSRATSSQRKAAQRRTTRHRGLSGGPGGAWAWPPAAALREGGA